MEVRPYQEAALCAWELAGRRGVVVLPTGIGKTRVALRPWPAAACARCAWSPRAYRSISGFTRSEALPRCCRLSGRRCSHGRALLRERIAARAFDVEVNATQFLPRYLEFARLR